MSPQPISPGSATFLFGFVIVMVVIWLVAVVLLALGWVG